MRIEGLIYSLLGLYGPHGPGSNGDAFPIRHEPLPAWTLPSAIEKTSSLGCVPTLASAGIASPTASSGYEVTASGVQNHTNGRLIYSLAGAASNPFAGGTLCVATPWNGTPVVSSGGSPKPIQDCSGAWVADLNTELAAKPGPQPGDTLYCQWIGRDRGFVAPDNYDLSSALELTLLP